jgi:post-segregation antitoxin (ccd killing protein)
MNDTKVRRAAKRNPTPAWVHRDHRSRGRRSLNITLPDALYERVQQLAGDLQVTRSRVIELALSRDVFSAEQQQMLQTYLHHLPRIGSNLNQIARWGNTYGQLPEETRAVLLEVDRLVQVIRSALP